MHDNENKRHLDEAILERDDLGVSKANGILSLMFRRTLCDININASTWNRLMLAYLADKRNRIPNNSRARSSTRGNLNKELSKTNMTWNNFQKAIRFLNPVATVFIMRLTWLNGRTTVHQITMGADSAETEEFPISKEGLVLVNKISKCPGICLINFEEILLAAELEQEGYLVSFNAVDDNRTVRKCWGVSQRGLNCLGI